MSGPTLYYGPAGRCPDCGKRLPFRVASHVGKVKIVTWKASFQLVEQLYKSAKARVTTTTKWNPRKSLREEIRVGECSRCYRTTTKLIWVAPDAQLGDECPTLVGPWCQKCFADQKEHFENQEGVGADLTLYTLSASPSTLARLLGVTADTPVEEQVVDTSFIDDLTLAETEGLF